MTHHVPKTRRGLLVALGFLVLIGFGGGDPSSARAATGDMDRYEIAAPHVRPRAGGRLSVQVERAAGDLVLDLEPYSLRAPDFRLLRVGPDGVPEILPAPAPVTYRGRTAGGLVAASVHDGKVQALCLMDSGERWYLEPVTDPGSDRYRFYPEAAGVEPEGSCGARIAEALPPVSGTAAPGCTRTCEIAIEMDYPRYQQVGGTNPAAMADVEGLLNAVELIYAHDLGITYRLTTLVLQTTLLEDRYAGSNSDTLLELFRSYWNSTLELVPRDVAHLLTGRAQGSFIGVAYIGTVCLTQVAFGWAETNYASLGYRVGISAHELGHNWGALHCDGQVDCYLMCSTIGGCASDLTRFGGQALDAISDFRDQAICLEPGDGAVLPTAPTPQNDAAGVLVGGSVRVDVLANDRDGNCDTIILSGSDGFSERGGTVTRSTGTGPGGRDELLYASPPGVGPDRFEYTARDDTGRESVATVEVTVDSLRTPANPPGALAGLRVSYYDLPVVDFFTMPDYDLFVPFLTEVVPTIDIPVTFREIGGSGHTDKVGAVFTGTVLLPATGTYTFYVESDDGSLLYVDGMLLVDNDGSHDFEERDGSTFLTAGPHAVRVDYFESGLEGGVVARVAGPTLAKQVIPPDLWTDPGVTVAYYDLSGARLPRFERLTPFYSEILADFRFGLTAGGILGSGRPDQVAVLIEGFLTVNTPGLYTFHLTSDDGSALHVGGARIVNNDGEHGFRERVGYAGLAAGAHAFRVEYFEEDANAGLELEMEGPGVPRQLVSPSRYTHVNAFREVVGALGGTSGAQGLAWGDADGDGDDDLFVSTPGAARLFANDGSGSFTDVTPDVVENMAPPSGAAWGDADNDGDLDLYVGSESGANALFRNDGSWILVEVTQGLLGFGGPTREVSWVDVNRDGRLDLFMANRSSAGNILLRNDGNLGFTDATPAAVSGAEDTWGGAWGDVDGDLDPDLLVVSESGNRLYRNDGDFTLVDVTAGPVAGPGAGRAAAWGDADGDGDLDLCYVTSHSTGTDCRLLRNDGAQFVNVSGAMGLNNILGDLRGVQWVDFDRDGWEDLYLVEGALGSFNPEGAASRLLRNSGSGFFEDAALLGANITAHGRAAAWADIEGDGDRDLVLAAEGGPVALVQNELVTGNHGLAVQLEGRASNRSGIGARLIATVDGVARTRVLGGDEGGTGKGPVLAFFGLGSATEAEQLSVHWPSGAVQTLSHVTGDREIRVLELADTTGFISQAIQIDGINDFNPGNLLDDDRGDAERSNLCPDDPETESPLDLGRVYLTNDAQNLYFGLEIDRDCFCEVNVGLAIDRNTPGGGASDAFLRKLEWSGAPYRPDFYLYDVVPDGCNPYNYEALYEWTGSWSVLDEGPNGLGIADGSFTEIAVPLQALGAAVGETLRVEVWITRDGANMGPLDAACNDGVQLSTPGGTTYDVTEPVPMTCLLPYVVLAAQPVPVRLAAFTAERRGDAALLTWRVAGGADDHAGFHVYREIGGGERERITSTLLQGREEYTFVDAHPPLGEARYWLAEQSRAGDVTWHGPALLTVAPAWRGLVVSASMPNPFRASTSLQFSTDAGGPARVRVFDLAGREVAVLLDGVVPPGERTLTWNGQDARGRRTGAGIYFAVIEVGGERAARRLVKLE